MISYTDVFSLGCPEIVAVCLGAVFAPLALRKHADYVWWVFRPHLVNLRETAERLHQARLIITCRRKRRPQAIFLI